MPNPGILNTKKQPWALFTRCPRYSLGALHSALCLWPDKTGISASTIACIWAHIFGFFSSSYLFECSDSPLHISSFTPSSLYLGNFSQNLALCLWNMPANISYLDNSMKIHKQKDPEYNSSSVSAPCGRFFFLPQEWKIWLFSLLTKSSLAWKLDSCSFQLRVRKKKRAPWIRVGFPVSSVTADGETWLEAVLTNDCHQRIKIPYVKALSGNVNEEFNDLCSLFLFCRLQIKINKYL